MEVGRALLTLVNFFICSLRFSANESIWVWCIPDRDSTIGIPVFLANSPGASGRYGAAFLRLIIDTRDGFQGTAVQNHVLSTSRYNSRWGEGRVLIGKDGLSSLLIWIHVDDVFLHGPTAKKLTDGLNHVTETALRLGLICQPAKTKAPAQVQKFCGFI